MFRCYVLGCEDLTTISARHKLFGMVAACKGHDPIRHGYAKPFFPEAVQARSTAAPKAPPRGGLGAKLIPPPPVQPSPAVGLKRF
jgi:hypothetical protein